METQPQMTLDGVWELGRELMDQWDLDEWYLEWSDARSYAGQCSHKREVIKLSKPWMKANLGDEALIRDIILHEIAHALAGPRAGHGPVWKRWARTVGATPLYRTTHGNQPQYPYQAYCTNTRCKAYGESLQGRMRPPTDRTPKYSCRRCWTHIEWRPNPEYNT